MNNNSILCGLIIIIAIVSIILSLVSLFNCNCKSNFGDNCVVEWGTCGGKDYTGPTNCCEGLICNKQDDYYSQCITGSSPPPPSPEPCKDGITWSNSGKSPCNDCKTCDFGIKTPCTFTSDTVCNPSPGPSPGPGPSPPGPPSPSSCTEPECIIPTFVYDTIRDPVKGQPGSVLLTPGYKNGRAFTQQAFLNAFRDELVFKWKMDLSNIPDNTSIVSTAYLVFPNNSSKYYCDMGFDETIINGHCMEIDFLEISGNKCIQSTYHDCNMTCKVVPDTGGNDTTCGKVGCTNLFTLDGNEKTIDCTAELKQDGKFTLTINNRNFEVKIDDDKRGGALKNILDTSNNSPAVFVVSAWANDKTSSNPPWWPGIDDDCKNFNTPENASLYPVQVSDVKVYSKSGKKVNTRTDFPSKKLPPPPTPPPPGPCSSSTSCDCSWTQKGCGSDDGSCCWKVCCGP